MGFFSKSEEEKKMESEEAARLKRMIITTLDIKRDYEILDIVVSKEIHVDEKYAYEAGKESLKERAAALGADAVVGVQLFLCNIAGKATNTGNRRWYGTAVKYK